VFAILRLELITDCIGKPTEEEISMFENEKARKFLRSLPAKKPTPLQKTYPTANPLGLDLLSKMLMFDPSKRITAEEALSHPYLVAAAQEYPAPTVGPQFQSPTKLFHDFEDSSEYVGRDVVCALLWLELTEFHLQENESKPERLPSIMQPAARFLLSTSMSPTSQAGLAALSPAVRISPVARIDTTDKVQDKSADHSSSDPPFSPSGRRAGTSFADAVRSPPPIKSPAARIQPVESAPITTSVARAAPAAPTTSLSKAPAASARALPTATQDAYGVRGVPATARVRPAPLPHSISAAAMPSYMRPKESSAPASQLSARAKVDAPSQVAPSRLPPTARPAGLPLKR
jgi:serine/threonine protein kinase